MHVKLKVLRGASAGKEIPVSATKFYIGRSEECQLRANSDAISRRHCLIAVTDQGVTIRDLGSRNGTYVNGVKIAAETRIQMGDQLRVGPLEFLVSQLAAPKAASKSPGRPQSSTKPDDDMAGLIDDWLSEGADMDSPTRMLDLETREFRMDDTNRIDVNAAKDEAAKAPAAEEEAPAEEETPAKPHAGLMSQRPGSSRNAPPKDTQEAAAQTLRKFFNRGGN